MDITSLNWQGLAIGTSAFICIGLFHPLVIKGEYYFGRKVNYAFAILGIVACIGAVLVSDLVWSSVLAVIAFSSFWSIKEVIDQEERVRKGWFPRNPRRQESDRATEG